MKKNLFLRKSAQEQAAADYLYFQATGASTIALVAVGNPDPISMSYSTNGKSWLSYTIGTTLNIADGGKAYFRASRVNYTFSKSESDYYNFQGTGEFIANGDLLYLLSAQKVVRILSDFCFARLFLSFSSLTIAPTISSQAIIAPSCFRNMFAGCSNLRIAMQLPFTTLAPYCYRGMYQNCASLTNAVNLPALLCRDNCYERMYEGCTSLTNAGLLFATSAAPQCCYRMFRGCTSLRSAPEIFFTNIKILRCIAFMFENASVLSYIRVNFTEWQTSGGGWGQDGWVNGVAATGLFECPSELPPTYAPRGWQIVNF